MNLLDFFLKHLAEFTNFDYFVFSINALIFLFSKHIASAYPKSRDESAFQKRLWSLRFINFVLFGLYFIAVFLTEEAQRISQTGLTLLLSYLSWHFIKMFTLKRFGRIKEIGGETVLTDTYQSEIFSLVTLMLVSIAGCLFIINIWEITDWLKATSVFGGLLIIIFSTKDVWAPDNIHGLILLYNGNIEPGSVVRVASLDLLAVVLNTSLTQTVFRDLRQNYEILIPNAHFRNRKIEVLSNAPDKGIRQFIDFNIGYGVTSKRVESFFRIVWEHACRDEQSINSAVKPRVRLLNNGDHAVTWRFFFTVKNPYRVLHAGFAVNRAAYDHSLETGIALSTPLTHQLLSTPEAEDERAPLKRTLAGEKPATEVSNPKRPKTRKS